MVDLSVGQSGGEGVRASEDRVVLGRELGQAPVGLREHPVMMSTG